MRTIVFFLAAGGCAIFAASFRAADPQADLEILLKANAYPFRIVEGRLSGRGAAFLETETEGVQFVAFGEEHNRRAVHKFAGALFHFLRERRGFQYLALEEDPFVGEMLSDASRSGGFQSVLALAKRYPNAFHMYTEEDFAFIADAGKTSTAPTAPIWGLNQVFGVAHVYERLVALARDGEARGVAQRLLNEALEYEGERFEKNVHYIAAVARAEDFEHLRAAFHPSPGSETERLIDQAALSNRIFAPYSMKPRPAAEVFYQSGEQRETNMKRLFAEQYKKAQAAVPLPKVLAMFGQLHMYRGLSERTDLYTLGNLLSELAIFNGRKSLHVYTAVDPQEKSGRAPLVKVAIEAAGDSSDGAVINLRPLISVARGRADFNPDLRRLIMGFDIFVFLSDPAQGSFEHLRTPRFRWYPVEER